MRWFVVLAIVIVGVVTAPRLFAQTSRPPAEVTDPIEALRAGYLLVRGEGGPHPDAQQWQRQPQAIRAAQVVAYRELLEITKGVAIYASTNVNDLMLASDAINARVQGTVQGAQTVYRHYDANKNLGIVYVRLPIKGHGGLTETMLPELKMAPPPPETAAYTPPTTALLAPAQPADGLIVDVTAHAFRPALVNRILTDKGEILYDPSKIAQEILVQRGSGDYTTDVGKAKAILGEHGSTHPLTIGAKRVVDRTNIEISSEEATAVFAANQHTNFLEGAKVVFVVK